MNRQRLNELHQHRGRLLERIARQRQEIAEAMLPVEAALATTDRVIARVCAGFAYVKARPLIVVAAVAVLLTLKARRTLRWARRGFIAWRTWRSLRGRLLFLWARS